MAGLIDADAPQSQRINKIIERYHNIVREGVPGTTYYVDSGHTRASDASGNTGKVKSSPLLTIDEAVGRCTANNGDYIVVAPSHDESVVAAAGLALDVAGITIVFEGDGADRAKITLSTDVDADMDVDAASVTLVRPRFVAGIDALTGPIDINAADCTIIDGLYEDGTGIDTTDCIVGVAAAIRLKILGLRYQEGDAAGTQKQSFIQLNGVDDAILASIDCRGDFATGNFENITDECLNIRFLDIYLDNINSGPQPGMVLDSNCDGYAENVKIRVASGSTYVSDISDINWSADCVGTGTDGETFGDPIGTAAGSGLEGKLDTIDGYHDVPAADTTDDVNVRDVAGKKDDAAVQTAGTTKSILAYTKGAVDALTGTPGVVTWAAAAAPANGVSMSEALRYLVEKQTPRIVQHEITFTAGGDGAVGAHDLFTVTGTVRARIIAICTTTTSIQAGATIEVGVAGSIAVIIAQTAADAPDINEIWHDATPDKDIELDSVAVFSLITNGADIIITVGTDTVDSGVMMFYCEWIPVSSDGAVVAA